MDFTDCLTETYVCVRVAFTFVAESLLIFGFFFEKVDEHLYISLKSFKTQIRMLSFVRYIALSISLFLPRL